MITLLKSSKSDQNCNFYKTNPTHDAIEPYIKIVAVINTRDVTEKISKQNMFKIN